MIKNNFDNDLTFSEMITLNELQDVIKQSFKGYSITSGNDFEKVLLDKTNNSESYNMIIKQLSNMIMLKFGNYTSSTNNKDRFNLLLENDIIKIVPTLSTKYIAFCELKQENIINLAKNITSVDGVNATNTSNTQDIKTYDDVLFGQGNDGGIMITESMLNKSKTSYGNELAIINRLIYNDINHNFDNLIKKYLSNLIIISYSVKSKIKKDKGYFPWNS